MAAGVVTGACRSALAPAAITILITAAWAIMAAAPIGAGTTAFIIRAPDITFMTVTAGRIGGPPASNDIGPSGGLPSRRLRLQQPQRRRHRRHRRKFDPI